MKAQQPLYGDLRETVLERVVENGVHATQYIRTRYGSVKAVAYGLTWLALCGGVLSAQPTTSIPRQGEFGHKAWQAPGVSLPVSGAILGEVRGITSTPPELFMWMGAGTGWVSLGGSGGAGSVGPQGPAGPAGAAATISVGTVSTGAPGSSATVTNAGTSSAAVFDFAIPRGDVGATGATGPTGPQGETGAQGPAGATGAAGSAATVAAGSTTTGLPGTSASVSNVGTSSAAIFNFTIPRGDVGATGAAGEDGEDGAPGAAGADGADGAPGAQGPAGDDGIPRTIQDEAVDLMQRLKVNFTGAGVTCVDNAGQTRTDCTIPGSSGIGGTVGATADAIPVADGTGGSTLKASTVKVTSGALIIPDGSEAATGMRFSSMAAGTGLYAVSSSTIGYSFGGAVRWNFSNVAISGQNGAQFRSSGVGSGEPVFIPGNGDLDTGLAANADNDVGMLAGNGYVQKWQRVVAGVWRATTVGQAVETPQAVTCADSGNGSPGVLTVNPTGSAVYVTNSDADGCAVTMGETNVTSGQRVELVVVSLAGGSVSFSDSSGITELAGIFAAGLYDSLALRYISDRWIETGRSDN